MTSPRFALAHLAGQTAGAASRLLGRGGGTVIAGVVAQAIDPRLRQRAFAARGLPLIAVSGSNGKTTTARLAAGALRASGRRVAVNAAGSNMIQGISTLALEAVDPLGRANVDVVVAEVDEAALLAIVDELRPRVIVVTNVVRDQLDRFGELYVTAAALERAALRQEANGTLVLCADDPLVAGLAADHPRRRFVGLEVGRSFDRITSAADSIRCRVCRAPLAYRAVYLGQMGDWRCPGCGLARPRLDVAVTGLVFEKGAMRVSFRIDGRDEAALIPQRGVHVAYDAALALAAAVALGVDPAIAVKAFERVSPAWGRLERLRADGRTVLLGLAKNPMSYRTVIQELDAEWTGYDLLLAHSSSVVDGEDFGWLWDVEFERLTPRNRPTTCAGDRAAEIANRLAYAGWDMRLVCVVRELVPAFERALAATPADGSLVVIAGYSPLRTLVEHAHRRGWTGHFWEH